MKQKVNKDNWNRNKQFQFFSKFDSPYTGCTTLIDVDDLIKFSKKNKISFYGLMTYFTISSLNKIEEFKYVLEENEIYKYDKINTSFSVLKDNKQINFSRTIEYNNFEKFIQDFNVAKEEAESDKIIPYVKDYNKCYITCTPWMRVTSVLNPMNYKLKDSIPRICWGKYFIQDGKYMIDYSIQVNHAFQDGYHIGLFINQLQEDIYDFVGGKRMILCVDLDDTLASSDKTINEYAIKFDKDILKRTTKIKKIDNCVDYYYFARMLNWDRNDLIIFFEQCYPKYLNDIKVKYGTRHYLQLIKELNIKIYIVTARKEINNDQVKKITINWLNKNKIYYDKLFINIGDKAKFLQKIKPDFYIDDSLKNCDSVEKILPSTRVYLMNTKYNKNVKTNHIRINSIKDFYYLVKESDINER